MLNRGEKVIQDGVVGSMVFGSILRGAVWPGRSKKGKARATDACDTLVVRPGLNSVLPVALPYHPSIYIFSTVYHGWLLLTVMIVDDTCLCCRQQ